MASENFFKRSDLAKQLASKILSDNPTSAARSGIFLAAPRRTGKSVFAREDLRDQLEQMGAIVIYADLWEDKSLDPAEVIDRAVRSELAKHEGVVTRLAKAIGMDSTTIGVGGSGVKFSLDRVGLAKEVTLSAALAALSDTTKRIIVLLIDEAQHMMSTEGGDKALFALKAARDSLNSSSHFGLRLVATGSNRNKLAMLTASKDQAFFGAPLVEFPFLDEKFVVWFCDHVDLGEKLDPSQVMPLFVEAGYRPEILAGAADVIRLDLAPPSTPVFERLVAAVRSQTRIADDEKVPVINALTPIQHAVLRVMAQMGPQYVPFRPQTLRFYDAAMAEIGATDLKADSGNVQAALTALQEKGLVWRARRGAYDIEDYAIKKLLLPVAAVTTELRASSSSDAR